MDLQHWNVKLMARNPDAAGLAALGGVFNGWIQRRALPEVLIDVADYRHVPAGPGVLLIGHEANYSLDNAGGRLGLLYNRKARVPGGPAEGLAQAVNAALQAAALLEAETALRFDRAQWEVLVNDRLLAPNTPETLARLRPVVAEVFGTVFGGARFDVRPRGEARQRFTLAVAGAGPAGHGR